MNIQKRREWNMRHLSRLSDTAREAIQRSLSKRANEVTVPLAAILRDVKASGQGLVETDEELKDHIVMSATDLGLGVEFD